MYNWDPNSDLLGNRTSVYFLLFTVRISTTELNVMQNELNKKASILGKLMMKDIDSERNTEDTMSLVR